MRKEQLIIHFAVLVFIALALLGLSVEHINAQGLQNCWTGSFNDDGEVILVQQETLPNNITPQIIYDMLNFYDEKMTFGNPDNTIIIQFLPTDEEAIAIIGEYEYFESPGFHAVTFSDATIATNSCIVSQSDTPTEVTGIIVVNAKDTLDDSAPELFTLWLNLFLLGHEESHSQMAQHNDQLAFSLRNTRRSTEYWERVFLRASLDLCDTPVLADSHEFPAWAMPAEKILGSGASNYLTSLVSLNPRLVEPVDYAQEVEDCHDFQDEVLDPNNLFMVEDER